MLFCPNRYTCEKYFGFSDLTYIYNFFFALVSKQNILFYGRLKCRQIESVTMWFILISFSKMRSGFYRIRHVFISMWVVVKDGTAGFCINRSA